MFTEITRRYKNYRRYRDTVVELQGLTNRELNDIGISRGEIRKIAKRSIDF